MRSGILAAALLCLAFGLLLAYSPRRLQLPALALAALGAVLVSLAPTPADGSGFIFGACWVSVAVTSLLLHLPRPLGIAPLLALATNTALWTGAVISAASTPVDLAQALPFLLVVFPAGWLLKTPVRVSLKIVGGWLVAVAILAGTLPLVSTASYEPDHLN